VTSIGDDLLSPLTREEDEAGDSKPRWKGLLRSGTNARRQDRKRMFYPVLLDEDRRAVLDVGEPLLPLDKQPDLDTKINGLTPAWPIRKDGSLGNWGLGAKTLKTLISKGYVSLGHYDPSRRTWGISYLARTAQQQIASGVLQVVSHDQTRNVVDVRYTAPKARRIKTVWHRTTHDAGAYGTDLLRAFLTEGRKFPFPKSLYVVRDTLAALVADKPDALIVDFFAGSGTTLHATCLLNREDGGRRRCILVTNNEVDPETRQELRRKGHYRGTPEYERHGIFEAVMKPRCQAAITGVRSDGRPLAGSYLDGQSYADGFEENVEFFRLDYVEPDEIELGQAFHSIHPLLWLAAGARGSRPASKVKDFVILPDCGYAVLFREDAFRDFEDALARHDGITHIFFVTDSEEAYAEMAERVGADRQTVMLYRDFLQHYRRQGRL